VSSMYVSPGGGGGGYEGDVIPLPEKPERGKKDSANQTREERKYVVNAFLACLMGRPYGIRLSREELKTAKDILAEVRGGGGGGGGGGGDDDDDDRRPLAAGCISSSSPLVVLTPPFLCRLLSCAVTAYGDP
jgi:hypothetical protein